jgi:hypothetical protein
MTSERYYLALTVEHDDPSEVGTVVAASASVLVPDIGEREEQTAVDSETGVQRRRVLVGLGDVVAPADDPPPREQPETIRLFGSVPTDDLLSLRRLPSEGGTRIGRTKQDETDQYIGRGEGQAALGDVPIGDRGWLGNPYVTKDAGGDYTRHESIEAFREDFEERLATDEAFRDAVRDLSGSVLGGWCQSVEEEGPACHGEVIAAWADWLASSPDARPEGPSATDGGKRAESTANERQFVVLELEGGGEHTFGGPYPQCKAREMAAVADAAVPTNSERRTTVAGRVVPPDAVSVKRVSRSEHTTLRGEDGA